MLGPGAKVRQTGRAEPADTGESGTRFEATQELCSIAVGSTTSGDQPCLKFGSGSAVSAVVFDAFLLGDRVLQEAVMFDKGIIRAIAFNFIPLAGEAIAGSVTIAIVEDAEAAANMFGGGVTRAKIEDTDNNTMFPVTRKLTPLRYRTHSRSPYYISSASGEDGHFYSQLALVALITGAPTANATYGILQIRITMDMYGKSPIVSLVQNDERSCAMRRMLMLREYFRNGQLPEGVGVDAKQLPDYHVNCRTRLTRRDQVGACNQCRLIAFMRTPPPPRLPKDPIQPVLMYATNPSGQPVPVAASVGGATAAAIQDTAGNAIKAFGGNIGTAVGTGDGTGNYLAISGGTLQNSIKSQIYDASGSGFTAAPGGALRVTETVNGVVLIKHYDTLGSGQQVLASGAYVVNGGTPQPAASSTAGVLATSQSTPGGTSLSTANGVGTAITAIGTTTTAVASGYLAVSSATGGPMPVVPYYTDSNDGTLRAAAGGLLQGDGNTQNVAIPTTGQVFWDASTSQQRGMPYQVALNGTTTASTKVFPISGLTHVGYGAVGSFVSGNDPRDTDITTQPLVAVIGQEYGTTSTVPIPLTIKDNGATFVNETAPDRKALPPPRALTPTNPDFDVMAIRRDILDEKSLVAFDALVKRYAVLHSDTKKVLPTNAAAVRNVSTNDRMNDTSAAVHKPP
jgi:hypothetical protein